MHYKEFAEMKSDINLVRVTRAESAWPNTLNEDFSKEKPLILPVIQSLKPLFFNHKLSTDFKGFAAQVLAAAEAEA